MNRRLVYLADANSVHTQKWVYALASAGYELHLISLTSCQHKTNYLNHPRICLHSLEVDKNLVNGGVRDLRKISYLLALPRLRRLIKKIDPLLVHAHYATSYGLLGALCGKRPFYLSLWGDDVLVFPKRSPLHEFLIKFILYTADEIFSTSRALEIAAKAHTNKSNIVIPFGIDVKQFKEFRPENSYFSSNDVVIGTIKSLEQTYGIDLLIRSFAELVKRCPDVPLKLLIVGGGSLEGSLKALVSDLGLLSKVVFTGKIGHDEIANTMNMLDVYVALSRSESFGVAILEAQSCGKPVVVSDVGGLPEVVQHGVTGFVVPAENVQEASRAIEKLVKDPALRKIMGEEGRKRVIQDYNWDTNVEQLIQEYRKFDQDR